MSESLRVLNEPDTTARTLGVSFLICLACSAAVSVATVILRPIQQENQRRSQQAQVAEVLARQPALADLIGDPKTASLEQIVVKLDAGVPVAEMDPRTFDARQAEKDAETSRAIPPVDALAGIDRIAKHAVVTIIRREANVHAVVLPIYGRGYASIIRGDIVIAPGDNEILGLLIHEHDETPGLGSVIEEPEFRNLWIGKRIWGPDGKVGIHVSMETSPPSSEEAVFRVDGISGATKSSIGVSNMVRFWLGADGFGPYLDKLRKGQIR